MFYIQPSQKFQHKFKILNMKTLLKRLDITNINLYLNFYGPHLGKCTNLKGLPWPVVSRVQGPAPKTTHDRTRTKETDTETVSLNISWNNSPLEKNPIAKARFEPRTSVLVGNNVMVGQYKHHIRNKLIWKF